MPKTGLLYLMDKKPLKGDKFITKKWYRFIPDFALKSRTIIELEIYTHSICVLSFFDKQKADDDIKYRQRLKLGSGNIRAIFRACIEAFNELEGINALVFSAANDIGKIEEDNARYSAYIMFLNMYIPQFKNDYTHLGSLKINTFIMYHNDYEFKDEAMQFYSEFESKTESNLVAV